MRWRLSLPLIFAALAVFEFSLVSTSTRVPASESTRVPASISNNEAFGFAQLEALAKRADVHSIEALLPLLPQDLRSNFTLVTKSNSRSQGATPENPRAILFGSSGKLILTFNGDSRQKGFSKLEILAFDDLKNQFELREIEFDGARAKISAANPPQCVLCHESHPRPIWREYRNWEGVMGAEDDSIGTSTEWYRANGYPRNVDPSFAEFDNFRTRALNHPRYQWLGWDKNKPSFPYHLHSDKSLLDSPNTRLTIVNVINLSRSIAARVAQHPRFSSFKYSLARGLSCQKEAKEMTEFLSSWAVIPEDERWIGTRKEWAQDVIDHEAILNLFGIAYGATSTALRLDNPGDASIRLQSGSLVKEDHPFSTQPARGAFVVPGFSSGLGGSRNESQSFVAVQVLREISKSDSKLAEMLRLKSGWKEFLFAVEANLRKTPEYYRRGLHLYEASPRFIQFIDENQAVVNQDVKESLCAYLKKRSAQELAQTSAPLLQENEIPKSAQEKAIHILVKSKCVACHAKGGLAEAPSIPFSNPKALRAYAKIMKSSSIDLVSQVRSTLRYPLPRHPDDENTQSEMPVAGAALRPEEVQVLLEYFEQIVNH